MKYLIVCLLLVGCGSAKGTKGGSTTNPSATPVKLYVYGDQIVLNASNYASQLATQENWILVNKAVAGTTITSANQYAALMSDVWESNAVVMWAFGNNEAAVSGALNVAYKNDIANVSARLISLNQKAILGGPSPYCGTAPYNALNNNVSSFWLNNVYAGWGVADPTLGAYPNLIYFRIGSGNMGAGAFAPTALNTNADCVTPNSTGYPQVFTDLLANWTYDCNDYAAFGLTCFNY